MVSGRILQPEFGQRLHDLRTQFGLSQRALAGDLVTPSYISLIERGDRVPTLDVAVELARTLNVSLHDLLGNAGELFVADAPAQLDVVAIQVEARGFIEAGDLAEAEAALSARLAAARADADEPVRLALGLELSRVLGSLGRHQERLAVVDELLALPSLAESPRLRIPLSIDRISLLRELGRLDVARREAEALHQAGAEAVGERGFVRLLGVLVSVLCEIGDVAPVDGLVTELLADAQRLGQTGTTGRAHWAAAMAYSRLGRPQDAAAQLTLASELLTYATMPVLDWLRFCRSASAVLLEGGDATQARQWIEVAERSAAVIGVAAEQRAVRRERARYELATGDPAAAAEMFARLVDGPDALTGLDRLSVLLGYGTALERLGRADEAVTALREAADLCESSGNFRQATEIWRRLDQLRQAAPARPRRRSAAK
jgi:transcriptional regulator with XRE-family HTH domain